MSHNPNSSHSISNPIVVPYIIPYITPYITHPLRSLDYSLGNLEALKRILEHCVKIPFITPLLQANLVDVIPILPRLSQVKSLGFKVRG